MNFLKVICTTFLLLEFSSCHTKSYDSDIKEATPSLSPTDRSFYSCMKVLAKEYDPGYIINSRDTNRYSEQFKLKKRLYLPDFQNLTFELRPLRRASDDDALVIFVYNDSVQFVLPFFDKQYYRSVYSGFGDSLKEKQYNRFSDKFDQLVNTLNIQQSYEVIEISNIVMDFLNSKPVKSVEEINLLIQKLKKISTKMPERLKCAGGLDTMLEKTKRLYENGAILYSDGSVVYRLTRGTDASWQIDILNPECFIGFRL